MRYPALATSLIEDYCNVVLELSSNQYLVKHTYSVDSGDKNIQYF